MKNKKYISFFEKYFENIIQEVKIDSEKIHINRKKEHTYRVVDNAIRIGKSLNLDENNLKLVYLSALFHDIGRFKQFKDYHTFQDEISIDHAQLSVDELTNSNILDDLTYNEKNLVLKSILIHNKIDIPKDYTKEEYLISSILRDADKLDMYYNMTKIIPFIEENQQNIYYSNKSNELKVSENIYNKILNKELIYNTELNTVLDKKLRTIGFITADIKHIESLKIIKENNYLPKIYESLPKIPEVITIYNFINDYLNSKT